MEMKATGSKERMGQAFIPVEVGFQQRNGMRDSCFPSNDPLQETRAMESGNGFFAAFGGKNEEGNNIDRQGVCV
jgi:hypothetical protein